MSIVPLGRTMPQDCHFVRDGDACMGLPRTSNVSKHLVWLLSIPRGYWLPLNPGTSARPCADVSYLVVPIVPRYFKYCVRVFLCFAPFTSFRLSFDKFLSCRDGNSCRSSTSSRGRHLVRSAGCLSGWMGTAAPRMLFVACRAVSIGWIYVRSCHADR